MKGNPREHAFITTFPSPDDEPSGYIYEGGLSRLARFSGLCTNSRGGSSHGGYDWPGQNIFDANLEQAQRGNLEYNQ